MQSFNRPPRFRKPPIEGTIQVPGPPSDDQKETQPIWQMMLPMLGMVVMALMYLGVSRFRGYGGMLFVLPMLGMSVIMVITTLVIGHLQRRRTEREKLEGQKRFLRLLYRREARLMAARSLQRFYAYEEHPELNRLYQVARQRDPELWQRHPVEDDFLLLRAGIGRMESRVEIEGPDGDEETEWLLEARRVTETYREIDQMPLLIDLKRTGSIGIVGEREVRMDFISAFLARLAVLHAPSEVVLYVVGHVDHYEDWKWIRWLPHVNTNQPGEDTERIAFTRHGVRRVMSGLSMELERRLGDSEGRQQRFSPQIILVCDGHELIQDERAYSTILQQGRALGAQAIFLEEAYRDVPDYCGAMIELRQDTVSIKSISGQLWQGHADRLPGIEAEAFMRRMAPVFMPGLGMSALIPQSVNYLDMLSMTTVEDLNIFHHWRVLPSFEPRASRQEKLPRPVPIGSIASASPTYIHLAENEHGPHGMIAGTTGSGKSELLQTLVASLATQHHPYLLNFLLLDYKGGATFRMFERLPHTVGMFSNLESADLAWRVLEGIKTEIKRRERFLEKHGVEDIGEYHQKTLKGQSFFPPKYEPMPHLLIIVDEFAQLARKESSYIPELVSTVQVGRSLGIHLILSTQSPEGVVNDDMLANLNFKICLRVQDIENSRAILKRPDAAYLPHDIPGRAYFQVGNSAPQLFQVARVGVEYTPGAEITGADEQQLFIVDFEEYTELAANKSASSRGTTVKLAQELVNHMLEVAEQMHIAPLPSPVLPQLPPQLVISHLWGQPAEAAGPALERKYSGGWDGKTWQPRSHDDHYLAAPVGRLDDLTTGTQELFWPSLAQQGNLLVIGGPQMGKTLFLITLLTNLMRLHRPDELHVFALAFGGNLLRKLEAFPHVGSVIPSSDQERVQRLLRELHQHYETRRNMTEQSLGQQPAILLVIDNLGAFRTLYEDHLDDLRVLIDNGRQYGIYIVLTANSAADVGYRMISTISQRICLPVAEKLTYNEIVGKPQGLSLAELPGRCFVRMGDSAPPIQAHIAYPGSRVDQDFESELSELAKQMNSSWNKPVPMAIGTLPQMLTFSQLMTETLDAYDRSRIPHVPLGYADHDLSPYWMNLDDDGTQVIIAGTPQSGKTAVLQTLCLAAAHFHHPEDVQLVILDPLGQKSWRPFASLKHTLCLVDNPGDFKEHMEYLKGEIQERRAQQARATSDEHSDDSEQFPAVIVVIDDFEIVHENSDYAAALNFLAQCIQKDRRLGLYVWVSGSLDSLKSAMNRSALLRAMQMRRTGLALGNSDAFLVIGGRAPRGLGDGYFPPGRGYMRIQNQLDLVHFAFIKQFSQPARWTKATEAKWQAPRIKLVEEKNNPTQQQAADDLYDLGEGFEVDEETYWNQRKSLNPDAEVTEDSEESGDSRET